ncbi:MAG TPA: DUF3570 domain-containing protein [bacterium]|nr:DUF3570 domain-containing protein [bacterium]
MQLSRVLAPAAALGLLLPSGSLAIGESEAELRFGLFTDSDHVHVSSAGGAWGAEMDTWRLALDWLREVVTVPGITAAPGSQEALDSVSGASRPIASDSDPHADFSKVRQQVSGSVRRGTASAGYYVSAESDYFAQQVSGSYEQGFLQDNLLLTLSGSYGWDVIEPEEDEDGLAADDRKTTTHGALVATGVLTPVTMVQGGLEIARVAGLQHNPYRNVYVAGAYTVERHPDDRLRQDVFVRLNQYLPNRASAKVAYKLYRDDWGIHSHTIESKLAQYVGERVIVRYRHRWYTQDEADFWSDEYLLAGGIDGYRTGDYRLENFSSHLFGARISVDLGRGPVAVDWLENVDVVAKYERYFNSNNFSANILETAVALSF